MDYKDEPIEDEDRAYERLRQYAIDDLHDTLKDIGKSLTMECSACGEIALQAALVKADFVGYECFECGHQENHLRTYTIRDRRIE